MELSPALVQFIGSLVGIFALAGLAYWLKLGPAPKLANENDARDAAEQAVSGFSPVEIGIDRGGKAALLRDQAGRLLLLRLHGNRFAGRILSQDATMDLAGNQLTVDSGEKHFGRCTLELNNGDAWVAALQRLKGAGNA